jgi:hypothetical protein
VRRFNKYKIYAKDPSVSHTKRFQILCNGQSWVDILVLLPCGYCLTQYFMTLSGKKDTSHGESLIDPNDYYYSFLYIFQIDHNVLKLKDFFFSNKENYFKRHISIMQIRNFSLQIMRVGCLQNFAYVYFQVIFTG